MIETSSVEDWELELDRLELEILQMERLLKAIQPVESSSWTPPQLDSPLPPELLPRAQEIHERQLRLVRNITKALRSSHQQRYYAEATSTDEVPVYIDMSA